MRNISILICISALLLLTACTARIPDLPEEEGKVWMHIAPVQCGDWSVPKTLYYHRGDLSDLEFPLTFNLTQDIRDTYEDQIKSSRKYERGEITDDDIPALIQQYIDELVATSGDDNPLLEDNIIIHAAVKGPVLDERGKPVTTVCEACSCSAGYILYIQVSEEDAETLADFRYQRVE